VRYVVLKNVDYTLHVAQFSRDIPNAGQIQSADRINKIRTARTNPIPSTLKWHGPPKPQIVKKKKEKKKKKEQNHRERWKEKNFVK